MANKLPSSSGYFNKEMLAILERGEAKKSTTKKANTAKKAITKKKSK